MPVAMEIVKRHPKTRPLTKALLHHLSQKNIALLAYSSLQRLISSTLSSEHKRLFVICKRMLSSKDQQYLKGLLESEESLYPITAIKQDVKEFSYTELKKEIKKHELLKVIFELAEPILKKTNLPKETIDYYGSLVNFYNAYKLKRMPEFQSFWYLLCYSFRRYQKVNDNLIEFFHHEVHVFHDEGNLYSIEQIAEKMKELEENLVKTGHVLTLLIHDNPEHPDIVKKEEAFAILPLEPMQIVQKFLLGETRSKHTFYWEYIDGLSYKIRRYLRALFLTIDFKESQPTPLATIIAHMQILLKNPQNLPVTDELVMQFIPTRLRLHLVQKNDDKEFRILWERFEFFFYKSLSEQIRNYSLFLSHSLTHKSLEDVLINKSTFEENRDTILENFSYDCLKTPIESLLETYRRELDPLIVSVNERIQTKENPHVKIKKTKKGTYWTLPYQKKIEDVNNPFFLQLPQVSIVDLLYFVDKQCGFLSAFTSIQSHSTKVERKDHLIMAALLGNAIRMGTYKMAANAKLNYSEWHTTEKTYIRLETLSLATDIINNATAELPIFPYWDIHGNKHDSLDGSKIGTRLNILKSRYSPKYYGLGKGVSSFNDCLNHLPINAFIIGAHEHESQFYFPMVYNNTTNIKATHHSGDGHSINQLNFTLFDMIGHHFMPHFPTIQKKSIHCFEQVNLYKDVLIKPTYQINEKLIKSEWPMIQRIIASILIGESDQATIIRILSSHDFCSKTKDALWEYDAILKSLYILHFIDDIELRKSVRKAINRTEAYHQLCRAITCLNSGHFKGKTEVEIEIWNECSRLIASVVMYYNSYIFSLLHEQIQDAKLKELVTTLSPVA